MLPRDEWPRLAVTVLADLWPSFSPLAQVIVVEAGDRIVGHWVLMPIWHVEFLQSAGLAVSRRLYRTMRTLTHDLGIEAVMTGALDDTVRGLLDHVGATRLPGDHYLWRVRQED